MFVFLPEHDIRLSAQAVQSLQYFTAACYAARKNILLLNVHVFYLAVRFFFPATGLTLVLTFVVTVVQNT